MLRMKPWENAQLDVTYFGRDRPRPGRSGCVTHAGRSADVRNINQGGHEVHALFTALLPDDWRAVADLDQLSSLTYRIAWSETFAQAVNSEVPRNAFLSQEF